MRVAARGQGGYRWLGALGAGLVAGLVLPALIPAVGPPEAQPRLAPALRVDSVARVDLLEIDGVTSEP